VRLIASHAVVTVLGVGAGYAYWTTTRESTRSLHAVIARTPILNAAELAFRFGTAEHARRLLNHVRGTPPETDLEWGDLMLTELKLAVVDGEHEQSQSAPAPHLAAARDACVRFRNSSCDQESLREFAGKLSKQRPSSAVP
jgi:hypothetical protein